jgi:hypothetical protein
VAALFKIRFNDYLLKCDSIRDTDPGFDIFNTKKKEKNMSYILNCLVTVATGTEFDVHRESLITKVVSK